MSNEGFVTLYPVIIGLSVALFSLGVIGVLIRRNAIIIFMSVELMLNAANLAFIAFARSFNQIDGQVFVFFVMVVAAAEVAVGLALIVAILTLSTLWSILKSLFVRGGDDDPGLRLEPGAHPRLRALLDDERELIETTAAGWRLADVVDIALIRPLE